MKSLSAVDCTSRALFDASEWDDYVTACSLSPSWGWLQFCLRQLCWLICQACVPLDWLWNGPKPGASLNHEEILSLLTLWSQSLMGGLLRFFFPFCFICLFFYHCALQLLVYMRTVEFVCTSINSPLKCFRIDHFLVSLRRFLQQRSFLGWRKSTHCPPPPPGWHKSLPPSARPERSFFD